MFASATTPVRRPGRRRAPVRLFGIVLLGLSLLVASTLLRDIRLTTLDQWQQAAHVLIVRYLDHDPDTGLQRLRVLGALTRAPPPVEYLYTRRLNPLTQAQPNAIMSFGNFTSSRAPGSSAGADLKRIAEREQREVFYAHPWHDPWPLVPAPGATTIGPELDRMILPDCVDGMTRAPLKNPTLAQLRAATREVIDRESDVRVTGVFWPAGEISAYRGQRCRDKRYNPSPY